MNLARKRQAQSSQGTLSSFAVSILNLKGDAGRDTVKGKNKVTINQGRPFHQQGARLGSFPPLPGNPLVTVITANYNHGAYLEDMILSVLKQDYEPIELIVIDGASTDNTLEILRKYEEDPRVRWISEPDGSSLMALNKGLKLARGDLIGIQYSTDTYQPGAIREAVQEFATDPNLALVFGNAYITDAWGVVTKLEKFPVEKVDLSVDDIITFKKNYGWLQTTFLRRDLALAIGGFDEERQTVHTYSLCYYMLEASRIGACSRRVSKMWATYREHPNAWNLSRAIADLVPWERAFACKEFAKGYKDYLTSKQYRGLYRTAYYNELFYRNKVLRQTIRVIPAFMAYVWFGGDLLLPCKRLMFRFLRRNALLHRIVRLGSENGSEEIGKKDVEKEAGAEIGMDTRWYLETRRDETRRDETTMSLKQ